MPKLIDRIERLEAQAGHRLAEANQMTLADFRHWYATGELDTSKPAVAEWLERTQPIRAWVEQVLADFEDELE